MDLSATSELSSFVAPHVRITHSRKDFLAQAQRTQRGQPQPKQGMAAEGRKGHHWQGNERPGNKTMANASVKRREVSEEWTEVQES
jgi:hypothetical protein